MASQAERNTQYGPWYVHEKSSWTTECKIVGNKHHRERERVAFLSLYLTNSLQHPYVT